MGDFPLEVICQKDAGRIYECQVLKARVAELEAEMAEQCRLLGMSASREAALVEVVECARGLFFGEDWNNGTHAKIYRPKLLAALAKIKEAS